MQSNTVTGCSKQYNLNRVETVLVKQLDSFITHTEEGQTGREKKNIKCFPVIYPSTYQSSPGILGFQVNTMSDTEDTSDPMPTAINADLVEQILRAKRGEPNKYASYWELDEEDIDEATEEQVKGDPSVRILWAAEHGKLDIIKELYETDNSLLMSKDKDGYTPLHRASYNDHLEVAQYLLNHGADIEARTLDGWTPLHSAANWGNANMASLLLRHGADVNAQTSGKQTPLHLAASNSESRETIELLLMAPFVDHTLKNVLGETAKDIAERTCKYHYLFEIADDAINQLSSR